MSARKITVTLTEEQFESIGAAVDLYAETCNESAMARRAATAERAWGKLFHAWHRRDTKV